MINLYIEMLFNNKNEPTTAHPTIWMNLTNIMLRERIKTQKINTGKTNWYCWEVHKKVVNLQEKSISKVKKNDHLCQEKGLYKEGYSFFLKPGDYMGVCFLISHYIVHIMNKFYMLYMCNISKNFWVLKKFLWFRNF